MKNAGTYKITRQGQITLPSEAREEMGLEEGDSMDFYFNADMVIMKKRRTPKEIFESLAKKTTEKFRERKITKEDVAKEIENVRKGR